MFLKFLINFLIDKNAVKIKQYAKKYFKNLFRLFDFALRKLT